MRRQGGNAWANFFLIFSISAKSKTVPLNMLSVADLSKNLPDLTPLS